MTPNKIIPALLVGAAIFAAAPALADKVIVHNHYRVDDDDKDWEQRYHHDEWKARGKLRKEKKRKDAHEYERPPVVIYRYRFYSPEPQISAAPPGALKPRAHVQPNFPRESTTEHAVARERQREILEKELAAELQLLAKARQELAERQAALSRAERGEENLQPFADNVRNHEQNIQALHRELRNLHR